MRFCAVRFDEVALLKLATDDEKRAEARCFLGLDHVWKSHARAGGACAEPA
jgi:hypothetical protein